MGGDLLLLHGLGVDHRMWALQMPFLRGVGRIRALDLPGFGSEPPLAPGSRTPECYADWVAERLRCLGVEAVHTVGYSMGGSIALLLALRHPQRVASLGLCCTSPCWGRRGRGLLARGFASLGRFSMEVFQRSVLWGYGRHGPGRSHRAEVVDMTKRAHRPTMLALYRALARLELRPLLGRIGVPALVVGGSRDWLAPPSHLRALHRSLPRAALHIVTGADHMLCLSHAQALSALLVGFLSMQAAGSRSGESWVRPGMGRDAG